MRPYLEKNPSQKRAGGVAQGVGPEFKPQYHTQKKVLDTIAKIVSPERTPPQALYLLSSQKIVGINTVCLNLSLSTLVSVFSLSIGV
jgi:hypothetical protein